MTVNDPNLRLHSVDQKFGPGTTITGNNSAVNGLYTSEPPANVYDLVIFDQIDQGANTVLRGANMPSADGSGSFSGTGGILLPGGNLAGYTMANEFGLIKGHWSIPPGGSLDSLTMTFSLVPADTPVPPVTMSLAQNGFTVDASSLAAIALSNFAQQGGRWSLFRAAIPRSFRSVHSDGRAGSLLFGALSDRSFQCRRFNPRDPVGVVQRSDSVGSVHRRPRDPALPHRAQRRLPGAEHHPAAREHEPDQRFTRTILFTSSNPSVAAVPASLTIPALSAPGDYRFASFTTTYKPVGADTPVTFNALFNGASVGATVTIPKTVDTVSISRAELTLKNLQLRVDAFGNTPGAVLTLYNAATGQLVGIMTDNGPSGGGEKYTFQGTVSPLATLLLKSSLNGVATARVSRK